MKKIFAFVAFILLLNSTISAQSEVRFGIQAGVLNFTWLKSNDNKINANGQNLGFKFGLRGELFFRENYALTAGVGLAFNQGGTLLHDIGGNFWPTSDLSQKSYNADINALANGVQLKYSLQYVEIPVGLKLQTREFGNLRYFAELPIFTLGILTAARGDIDGFAGDATTVIMAEKENIKPDVVPITFAWGLGGGVTLGISENTSLFAAIYYQQGITDVTANKNTNQFIAVDDFPKEDSKGTIGSITLQVGVMF